MTTLLILATVGICLTGCNHLPRAGSPDINKVFDRFDAVDLGESQSADVLAVIKNAELGEIVSQDESVVVSWAQRGDYAVTWFNAVAFDDDGVTAKRKYAFIVDEDSPGYKFTFAKGENFRMDLELIIDDGTMDEAYTSLNEKRIAMIEAADKLFKDDIRSIRDDSDAVNSVSMLINNVFSQILEQLDRSPAKASLLNDLKGMDFDHTVLGAGKVRVMTCGEKVRIKIKIGDYTDNFETHEDVKTMHCS